MTVEIRNLARHYGRDAALAGIDLDIADGEFLALLGPSGAGKTTLLRLIAGLDRPDAGTILTDGVDTRTLAPRERRIGFVFQNYALFRHMTVARNIAFGLSVQPRRQRPSRARTAARVAELLDLMQLPGLGERFPAQLSGGQRQRVALARALAIEPKVLLLDEPFGALDTQVRGELRDWLRGLQRQLGLTTVFVTHDQHEAFQLADRVAILNSGRTEQIGTPASIRADPASAFVRAFIGAGGHALPAVDHFDLACRCAERTDSAAASTIAPARLSPPPAAYQEKIAMPQCAIAGPADIAVIDRPRRTPPTISVMPASRAASNDLPVVAAGELWMLAVAPDAAPTPFETGAIASASVIIYDRRLTGRVADLLPLGGYAEPATANAVDRRIQFVRDGWSVLRLTEWDAHRDPTVSDIQVFAERLRRAGAPAELRVRRVLGAKEALVTQARLESVCALPAAPETGAASDPHIISAVIFGAFATAAVTSVVANGLAG